MALNTEPLFTYTPRIGRAALSAANTERIYSTGTMEDVIVGVDGGTKVFSLLIQATGTTTAGVVRIWINDGSNRYLIKEQMISAITPSTTIPAEFYTLIFDGVNLPDIVLPDGNHKIQASTHNAETFNVVAFGGDLTVV